MKNARKKTVEVICPNCLHTQVEHDAPSDKFAWQCRSCLGVFEGDKPHALQKIARFIDYRRGNVCTGFGGLAGQVHHEVVRD
jgi:ribosomal protein S27E